MIFFKKYGKKSLNYKADIKIKYQSRSDVKTVTASRQLVFGADQMVSLNGIEIAA